MSAASAATAMPAAAHGSPSVRVVRCHTGFGITPGKITVPKRIGVRGSPHSTAGLVAYTNTVSFLIGPANMRCSGAVGADGGNGVTVWPRGAREPRLHSHIDGLTLQVVPACVGCMATMACPFFPAFARKLMFPCPSGVPAHEVVTRPSTNVALFEDPPGVAGDGYPSGGPDPANGVDGIKGRNGETYTATCTLPARQHSTCTVALNDVISRYG
jgi:hypothetical protein